MNVPYQCDLQIRDLAFGPSQRGCPLLEVIFLLSVYIKVFFLYWRFYCVSILNYWEFPLFPASGEVITCGDNNCGQLGYRKAPPTSDNPFLLERKPQVVTALQHQEITKLACGDFFCIACSKGNITLHYVTTCYTVYCSVEGVEHWFSLAHNLQWSNFLLRYSLLLFQTEHILVMHHYHTVQMGASTHGVGVAEVVSGRTPRRMSLIPRRSRLSSIHIKCRS